jgi:hypothetical protein
VQGPVNPRMTTKHPSRGLHFGAMGFPSTDGLSAAKKGVGPFLRVVDDPLGDGLADTSAFICQRRS